MANHMHPILVPETADGLTAALGRIHRRSPGPAPRVSGAYSFWMADINVASPRRHGDQGWYRLVRRAADERGPACHRPAVPGTVGCHHPPSRDLAVSRLDRVPVVPLAGRGDDLGGAAVAVDPRFQALLEAHPQ